MFMQLMRDLFAIAKFLLTINTFKSIQNFSSVNFTSSFNRCHRVRDLERKEKKHFIVLALAKGPVEKSFFTHETCTVSDTGS